jgi:hypothetical protein
MINITDSVKKAASQYIRDKTEREKWGNIRVDYKESPKDKFLSVEIWQNYYGGTMLAELLVIKGRIRTPVPNINSMQQKDFWLYVKEYINDCKLADRVLKTECVIS